MSLCSRTPCPRRRTFNVEGKMAAYCKQHAKDGMVNVDSKRCSRNSCTTKPTYNVDGSKTAAYCRQHAEDGMVNVYSRRCSHDSCTTEPVFNVEGSKVPAYCRKHAQDGMVGVRSRRCLHDSCMKQPMWGVLTDGAATVCPNQKGDVSGGTVISFRARCNVTGCPKLSRWGLDGKQSTHCRDHGPLKDGLVCTVGKTCSKIIHRKPSYGAVRGPTLHVKIEALF